MTHSPIALETIRFIRTLTDDGSLNGEEVWSLANWLNQHVSACAVWPGNLLVGPLQAAFEDGELSPEEMDALGALLSKIERDWAGMQKVYFLRLPPLLKTKLPIAPPSSISSSYETASISAILVPSLPIIMNVRSHSSDEEYEVNLNDHTCQCGDYVGKRRKLPLQSIGRCCKHLVKCLHEHLPDEHRGSWLAAVLEECCHAGRGVHPEYQWHIISPGTNPIAISKAPREEWANVYARRDGTYERFGFNTDEERWSYGEAPTDKDLIITAIQGHFSPTSLDWE